jgi:hypothetical protein
MAIKIAILYQDGKKKYLETNENETNSGDTILRSYLVNN